MNQGVIKNGTNCGIYTISKNHPLASRRVEGNTKVQLNFRKRVRK